MEDPNFVPRIGVTNVPAPSKRAREGNEGDDRAAKKKATEIAEEEMEIEDDD